MKKLLERFWLARIAAICCLLCSARLGFCQRTEFSGLWLLGVRRSLTGMDYANGLPKQIRITQMGSAVILQEVIASQNGDMEISDTFPTNDRPLVSKTEKGNKKVEKVYWTNDGTSMVKIDTLYGAGAEAMLDHWNTEIFSIGGDGKLLTIRRMTQYRSTPAKNWSMEAEYDLVSPGLNTSASGIYFERVKDWESVLAKARRENKYIFVDCYTTWCGPCKALERDIYPLYRVGNYMNKRFISLKLQMDSTRKDSDTTREWYQTAHAFQERYKVNAYPTLLFFSPDGRIVHRGAGYLNADLFISLAAAALDSSKQYYTLMDNYGRGIKNYPAMRTLALTAKMVGKLELALKMASDYINGYMDSLSDSTLCSSDNIRFVNEFSGLMTSKSRLFTLCYNEPDRADGLIGREGFSKHFVESIINREDIYNKLWQDGDSKKPPRNNSPDWQLIAEDIGRRYTQVDTGMLISKAQVIWYASRKDGSGYADAAGWIAGKYPPKPHSSMFSHALGGIAAFGDDSWGSNCVAWNLFQITTDKKVLQIALHWIDLAIKIDQVNRSGDTITNNLEYWDTKANILYKLGRIEEAIALEKRAAVLSDIESRKAHAVPSSEYWQTVAKMKAGSPTWDSGR